MASAVISFITWAVRHLRCSSCELMCVIFIQRVQPALTVIGSWSVSSRFCFGIANSSSSLRWLSQPAFSFHRSISSSTCREWQRQLPRRPARSNHSINTFLSISSSTCRESGRGSCLAVLIIQSIHISLYLIFNMPRVAEALASPPGTF